MRTTYLSLGLMKYVPKSRQHRATNYAVLNKPCVSAAGIQSTLSLLKVTEAKVTLVQRRPFSILFLFFVYKYFVWRSIVQSNSQLINE